MDEAGAVRTELDGSVLRITLDRPAKLNALRVADLAAVRAAVSGLDGSVRAVVFTGAGGRAFTAGMHVEEFHGLTEDAARALITEVRDVLAAVRTAPVATVCAVDGHCLGVGFELALACDVRVATEQSGFGLPEILVGVPSVVDAALLAQYVGLGLAKEMILTGAVYPVSRFAGSGLCNEVVAPDGLDAAVRRWLDRVAVHTRTVTAAQKRLFEIWQNTGLEAGTRLSVQEFVTVATAEETGRRLAEYRASL